MIGSDDLFNAINHFIEHRQLKGVSPGSIMLYRLWLRLWCEWRIQNGLSLTVHDVTLNDLRRFFLYLRNDHILRSSSTAKPRRGLAPASIASIWSVIRSFWLYLEQEHVLQEEQSGYFRGGRLPKPEVPIEIRPTYSSTAFQSYVHACELEQTKEKRSRSKAILFMLYDTGMRVSELCGMRDEDLDMIYCQARIIGKKQKQRYVFWSPSTSEVLAQYLQARLPRSDGLLFGITSSAVRKLIRRLAKRTGVPFPKRAPVHALRHTYAHRALRKGIDGMHLKQIMGHADASTTLRYVLEHPDDLRSICQCLWQNDETHSILT